MTCLRTFSVLLLDPVFIVLIHTALQYRTLESLIQQYIYEEFLNILDVIL